MATEVFYTQESVDRFINKLRDEGTKFTCDTSYDFDEELDCWVVTYDDNEGLEWWQK